jgi:arylsulfatase A-like enzyme
MNKVLSFIFFVFSWFWTHSQPPNVILIVTDDQGYGEVAAHGNKYIKTPEMDALYRTGVRLDNFHVNAVCSPSRAALMTGKYATNVGVWHTLGGRNMMNKDEKILPQFFKEAGYKTALVGKWHLGDNFPYRPEDRGFDEVFRIGGGSLGQVADYWGNGLWNGHYLQNGNWVNSKGFSTDVQFDAAINFIDRYKNKPFLLTIATTAPHAPTGADYNYLKPYIDMGLAEHVAKFYGMVTNIDDNIGKLRRKLEALKISNNTIVIFMSDNGSANDKKGSSFNGGMRGKKGSLYEGGHRVPCFLYWPLGGWVGGKQLNQVTAHIDLLPTLLKACSIENLSEVQFNGLELNEHIADPSLALNRYLITEAKVNKREAVFNSGVVLKDSWRLIGGRELFDLRNDSFQRNNILKENMEVKEDLETYYRNWFDSCKYRFEEFPAITISPKKTELFCMDLYPGDMTKAKTKVIWNQKAVLNADYYRGFWMVDVIESGTYTVSLRRWPESVNEPILRGTQKAKELRIKGAQLFTEEKLVTMKATSSQNEVRFEVELNDGIQNIQAEFVDSNGEAFSAYYLYIKKK